MNRNLTLLVLSEWRDLVWSCAAVDHLLLINALLHSSSEKRLVVTFLSYQLKAF